MNPENQRTLFHVFDFTTFDDDILIANPGGFWFQGNKLAESPFVFEYSKMYNCCSATDSTMYLLSHPNTLTYNNCTLTLPEPVSSIASCNEHNIAVRSTTSLICLDPHVGRICGAFECICDGASKSKWVFTHGMNTILANHSKQISMYTYSTLGRPVLQWRHPSIVTSISNTPNPHQLTAVTGKGEILTVDMRSESVVSIDQRQNYTSSCYDSSNNHWVTTPDKTWCNNKLVMNIGTLYHKLSVVPNSIGLWRSGVIVPFIKPRT